MAHREHLVLGIVSAVFVIAVAVMCVIFPKSTAKPTLPESDHNDTAADVQSTWDSDTEKVPDTAAGTEAESEPASSEHEPVDTPDTSSHGGQTPPPVASYGDLFVSGGFTPSDSSLSTLDSALRAFGRQAGICAIDIETGVTISYNADTRFAPASIVKAVFALYCMRCVDEGQASLDEILTYTEEDDVNDSGECVIEKMGYGAQLTLRDVIYHTINTSDNEGYYMLLRRFGKGGRRACDAMTAALGCTTCKISESRWPTVSARDMALIWEEIYRYRTESDNGRLLYEMFEGVAYMHFFRDALGVPAANKAGWNGESYNECGIVCGDRTYVLAVLSKGSYYTANKTAFADIVRAVNSMMTELAASHT